jgi:hypothetical protein
MSRMSSFRRNRASNSFKPPSRMISMTVIRLGRQTMLPAPGP